MYLIYVHWNEIYLLSFLCDICNEVYKHMQWLSEFWWDHDIMISCFQTYVIKILIHVIFEKDIKLFRNNIIIRSESFDEYGWSYSHRCGDTKDR